MFSTLETAVYVFDIANGFYDLNFDILLPLTPEKICKLMHTFRNSPMRKTKGVALERYIRTSKRLNVQHL